MSVKKKAEGAYSASYTIEASYIMAIILGALTILLSAAYDQCRQETGIMRLHHQVELVRGQDDDKKIEFTSGGAAGKCEKKRNEISGEIKGDNWGREISAKAHRPEEFMRMISVFQEESGDKGNGESE